MSKLKFIDVPQARSLAQYQAAIDAMVTRLESIEGVKSIYQIGSVSNAGISDIDMMIVFEDGFKQTIDPVRDLPTDTYLFTHQLYGVAEKYWEPLRNLTFFHNYKHLKGTEMPLTEVTLSNEETADLQRQIALEFLVKMHTVLTVQLHYKIVKLRSFLLEGKALIYDLEFLGISEGKFHQLVSQIIEWRANWFTKKPSLLEVEKLIFELHQELEQLLGTELNEKPLLVPDLTKLRTARNLVLKNGPFSADKSGFTFPSLGLVKHKKHFNLLHRFNSFEFSMPLEQVSPNKIDYQRFELLKTLRIYNQEYLPSYLVPASSLRLV